MRHIQPQICQQGFVVLFFLLPLPGKGADSQTPGYTLCAQRSVWVAPGLCVEIPCTFTVPAGSTLSTRVTAIWRRKETPDIVVASTEASMVSEATKGRFTLTGKVQGGDCSFSISNAQPADQGEYEFRIEAASHKYSYTSYRLRVTVTGADGQTPGYTLYAQRSVWVAPGLYVEIPCTFTVPAGSTLSTRVTGIWRKKKTPDIIVASTEASMVSKGTKGRFTLTGKVQEGDCSFSISNAQPADQGEYEFRIEDGSHKHSYSWYKLSVSVTGTNGGVDFKGADGQTPGYTLSAHRSVSVASGLCVEIPCTFTVPAGNTLSTRVTGIWRKKMTCDIVAASTNDCIIHKQTKGRFTLTGKVHEGDCSFSISNAQPADRGVYEFRIEDGSHKYSYIWNHLIVSVSDLPEPTISPVGELIAGKPITLTCTAHPAPQGCKGNITWGGRINIENISNYEREDQAGKVTSKSDIIVTPSQREHNSPLTCTVTYSGVSTNSSITLDVQSLTHDKKTNHLIILMIRGLSILVLSGIIAVSAVLVMRCRKKRRPPQQAEESQRSKSKPSLKNYQVAYSNTK